LEDFGWIGLFLNIHLNVNIGIYKGRWRYYLYVFCDSKRPGVISDKPKVSKVEIRKKSTELQNCLGRVFPWELTNLFIITDTVNYFWLLVFT
jgi:hypothetical protein